MFLKSLDNRQKAGILYRQRRISDVFQVHPIDTKPATQYKPMNRVLIVDDEVHIREMLKKDLQDEGYEVFAAANGEDGLNLQAQHQPQVIILDLNMPVMSGLEFLQNLKPKVDSPYSTIVLTGFGTDEDVQQCYHLGVRFFLRKPVNLFELEGLVNRNFELIQFSTTLIELSDRLKREIAEKEQTNNLLKSTFDGMAEGVVGCDAHFLIHVISGRACRIIGISEKEALGKSAASILGPEIAGPSGILLESVGSEREVSDTRTTILSPSGTIVPVGLTVKPLSKSSSRVDRLLLFRDLREEERTMREKSGGVTFGRMISCDLRMKEVFRLIEDIAPSNASVLVQGDSGTGKELVALEIHTRSRRAQNIFHAVNCGAIPTNLLESEFFGHERGAFTGAYKTKKGRFELANGGTLLLDEITEIPLELQVKLLRALQEREFERVGGTSSIKVDIRIIAATNQNIRKMVEENKFRQDLFYRLDVVPIKLPPLQTRISDIPLLTTSFIDELNQRENRRVKNISADALQLFFSYAWPGNIRELYHVVEYAFAVSRGTVLLEKHLPDKLREFHSPTDIENTRYRTEKEAIFHALEQSNFRKGKAAALLGISYSTLHRKMKKYTIETH